MDIQVFKSSLAKEEHETAKKTNEYFNNNNQ